MGKKGAKLTEESTTAAEALVARLSSLGDVTCRKMFGGYGVFESKSMFALVTSQGEPYLKVGDTNRARFEKAEAVPYGKMPYQSIPDFVLDSDELLREWAQTSIQVARGK